MLVYWRVFATGVFWEGATPGHNLYLPDSFKVSGFRDQNQPRVNSPHNLRLVKVLNSSWFAKKTTFKITISVLFRDPKMMNQKLLDRPKQAPKHDLGLFCCRTSCFSTFFLVFWHPRAFFTGKLITYLGYHCNHLSWSWKNRTSTVASENRTPFLGKFHHLQAGEKYTSSNGRGFHLNLCCHHFFLTLWRGHAFFLRFA